MANGNNGNGYEVKYLRAVSHPKGELVCEVVYVGRVDSERYMLLSNTTQKDFRLSDSKSLRRLLQMNSFSDVPIKDSKLLRGLIETISRTKPGEASPELTQAVNNILNGH